MTISIFLLVAGVGSLLWGPTSADTYATCRAGKVVPTCYDAHCAGIAAAKERGACQATCVETRSCGCPLDTAPEDKKKACGKRISGALAALKRPTSSPFLQPRRFAQTLSDEDLALLLLARGTGDIDLIRKTERLIGLSDDELAVLNLHLGTGERASQYVKETSNQIAGALLRGRAEVIYDAVKRFGFGDAPAKRALAERLSDPDFVAPMIDRVQTAPTKERAKTIAIELMLAADEAGRNSTPDE